MVVPSAARLTGLLRDVCLMTMRPATRLFVPGGLAASATIILAPAQAHYLRSVLRLAPGSPVALFNGRDGEWLGRIESLDRGRCMVSVEECRRAQTGAGDLWLVFAPVKRAPIDFLVLKATELGVSALLPVATRRTVVDRVNTERLLANAIEAAEQCERLTVPAVHDLQPLDRLLARWPLPRRLLLCDETGTASPIATALATAEPGPWAVLVGPEGGFAEPEIDAMRKLPFVVPVGLGPRVLRSDTAALAALAVFQARVGDWGAGRAP